MPPYKYTGPVDCTAPVAIPDLNGKVAIVTGGANGIGEAYVRALVSANATVCIGDLNTTKGEALTHELPNVHFVRTDTTSWDDQVTLFTTARSLGPISYVVANAGMIRHDDIFDVRPETPTKPNLQTIDVNVVGALYTTKLALHRFVRQNGITESAGQQDTALVLIGSGASHFDGLRSPTYWASKWAMRGLLHGLRQSVYHHGTRVNLIAPYYIKTNILSEEVWEDVKAKGVVFAELEDAQRCLLKILGDRSVNGKCFFISGKKWASQGFFDLDVDDYTNELLQEIQVDQLRHAPAELGLFVD